MRAQPFNRYSADVVDLLADIQGAPRLLAAAMHFLSEAGRRLLLHDNKADATFFPTFLQWPVSKSNIKHLLRNDDETLKHKCSAVYHSLLGKLKSLRMASLSELANEDFAMQVIRR